MFFLPVRFDSVRCMSLSFCPSCAVVPFHRLEMCSEPWTTEWYMSASAFVRHCFAYLLHPLMMCFVWLFLRAQLFSSSTSSFPFSTASKTERKIKMTRKTKSTKEKMKEGRDDGMLMMERGERDFESAYLSQNFNMHCHVIVVDNDNDERRRRTTHTRMAAKNRTKKKRRRKRTSSINPLVRIVMSCQSKIEKKE